MTVLQSAKPSLIVSMVFGPTSRPNQSSGILSMSTTLLAASAANLSATTTSDARYNLTPFSAAIFSNLRAKSS